MLENKEFNKGVKITGMSSLAGTIVATVAGTALAAPTAIGAGVGLIVWGVVELSNKSKK